MLQMDTGLIRRSSVFLVACFLVFMCVSVNAVAGGVVGLLSTKSSTYHKEYDTAVGIMDLLLSLGAEKVMLIDYNDIVKAAEAESEIRDSLSEFLFDNNIDRIMIPGNYYNISSEPLPSSPNRQLVTDAIVNLVQSGEKIRLLAICGGLQGVLHAQNVKIKRVEDMLDSKQSAESHVISMPDPRLDTAPLVRVIALPGTKLGAIVKQTKGSTEADGMAFYLPDAHSEAVYNTKENIERLGALGYKIAALSDDGIVESLEDEYGNMLIQMHPEYLLMNMKEKLGKHRDVDLSINIALAIMRDFLWD